MKGIRNGLLAFVASLAIAAPAMACWIQPNTPYVMHGNGAGSVGETAQFTVKFGELNSANQGTVDATGGVHWVGHKVCQAVYSDGSYQLVGDNLSQYVYEMQVTVTDDPNGDSHCFGKKGVPLTFELRPYNKGNDFSFITTKPQSNLSGTGDIQN